MRGGQFLSWARDERARIPFALIGVLLLATSVSVVVSMEMREDPGVDIDEELAMDRSEAAALAALQSATSEAVSDAAEAPVTRVNESNAIGQALAEADDGDVFENYVRLRIYRAAVEHFRQTSQEFDEGVTTSIDLSPIRPAADETADVVEKLERVHLDVGHQSDTLEAGKLTVAIEGVGFELHRGDETVLTETQTVETTIGTTLFELHETTDQYESQLDMGFFEGGAYEGFGQYMAARLYAVAYLKSGGKYAAGGDHDNPLFFDEILPNNQTEVLANHAIYSLQRDVFDTSDPYSSRAMRSQAGCLLAETAGEMADFDYVDEVCKGIELIYGDIEGDQPEAPTVSELLQMGLGELDALEETMEVEIDYPAALAVRDVQGVAGYENPDDLDLDDLIVLEDAVSEVTGEDLDLVDDLDQALDDFRTELDDLFDDIYTVETDARITVAEIDASELNEPEYGFDPPGSTTEADWIARGEAQPESVTTTVDEVSVEEEYSARSPATEELFYTVRIAFGQEVTLTQTFEYVGCVDGDDPNCPDERPADETAEATVTVTVDPLEIELFGEYAPDVSVRDAGDRYLDHAYADGGSVGFDWANYQGTPEYALNKTFDPDGQLNLCAGLEDLEVTVYESDVPVLLDAIRTDDRTTFVDTLVDVEVRSLDQAEAILLECFDWDFLPGHLEEALEPEDVLDHRVTAAGMASPSDIEITLEETLSSLEEPVADRDDVTDAIGFRPSHELMAVPRVEGDGWLGEEPTDEYVEIKGWLDEQLEEMVTGSSDGVGDSYATDSLLGDGEPNVEPAEAPRHEFLDSNTDPILQLVDNLGEVEDDIRFQDAEDDRYRTVMDMARTESYDLFVKKTEDWIYDINHLYNSAIESVENEIDQNLGAISEILDTALEFLQDTLDPDPEFHAGEIEHSPLFDDVTYEIHGSPTYLSMDVAEREVVPTVRPGDGGRFAGREDPRDSRPPESTNHSSFYSQYQNHLPYPGLPILPEPFPWIISLSTWEVNVGGEYARFEVSATVGSPDRPDPTTYVREQRPISLAFDGTERHVGWVEPINFESSTWIVVIMPGGQPGVGDGGGLSLLLGPRDDCSITTGHLGPDFEASDRAAQIDYDEIYPDNEDPIDDPTC